MRDITFKHDECPLAGAYPKCNNAAGCAACSEFEKHLKEIDLELALSACPCCGGTAHFFERNFGLKAMQKVSVRCDVCLLQTRWVSNRVNAARLWNRRATGEKVQEPK